MWKLLISIALAFAAMEPVSWLIHKYIMHGPLWKIHKTHHLHKGKSWFELNDLFSLLFGSVSMILIYTGLHRHWQVSFGLGLGIALYGVVYFLFHDVVIHHRYFATKGVVLPRFLQRLARAHYIHHKSTKSPDAQHFGLLFVNFKDKNSV